jgi:RNA polymerase sigma factor (sigma-70 family)
MRRPSNTEIFAQLYDEFMPKVFAYVHYRVNDRQTTEDLTSIVFEKALANFTRYSSDKGAFSTWIFTIARNSVIDHFRTGAKMQHFDLDDGTIDVPSTDPSPEEQMESRSEKQCLLTCLSKLGDSDREIVQLKFAAEMTNRQISRMLRLSESNVGVRLFRAVRKLRADFEESWNG